MSVFARKNKVLYVQRRPYLRHVLKAFSESKLGWKDLTRPILEQVSENLYIHHYPVWAPLSGVSPVREYSLAATRWSLRRSIRRLGMSNPIVWYSMPDMVDLLDEIPSVGLRIYHVMDEYSSYSGQTERSLSLLEQRERKLMALVDAVVVVSKMLYDSKSPYNPHTYLIPNAVDYRGYETALADPQLPAALAAIPTPRLGYIGLVGEKLNLAMLLALAQENPQWSLVFLGPVRLPTQGGLWQALTALPNVHHLGAVDVSQVPHYVKGFQVGLMPNLQNLFAENCRPLKLYDYLAAGIPVASIDIPPARPFGLQIHLAPTPDDFCQAVRAALADTSPARRHERRRVAAQETWEARVEKLSELIVDCMASR